LVYFSGHGNGVSLLMQDNVMKIEDLIDIFKPNIANNPVLAGMARMFFFDATVRSHVTLEGNMLVACASTLATETPTGGGWTNCLAKALRESEESDSVLDVLSKVNSMLKEQVGHIKHFQTATSEFYSSLDAKNIVHFKKDAKQGASGT